MAGAYLAERARLPAAVPVTLVFNKIDLIAPGAGLAVPVSDSVRISARTGEGIEQLRSHLQARAGLEARDAGSAISARGRHLEALERAATHLQAAMQQLAQHRARELVAEELRCAQRALEQIIGAESSDELLGRIFAAFCIGK